MTKSALSPFTTLGHACQAATRWRCCVPNDFKDDVLGTGVSEAIQFVTIDDAP